MPKLKSAVNSFLLTKKRLKRRKTHKRRTNRRYKIRGGMRGGTLNDDKLAKLFNDMYNGNNGVKIDTPSPSKSSIIGDIIKNIKGTDLTQEDFNLLFQDLFNNNTEDELKKIFSEGPLDEQLKLKEIRDKIDKPPNNDIRILQILDSKGNILKTFEEKGK